MRALQVSRPTYDKWHLSVAQFLVKLVTWGFFREICFANIYNSMIAFPRNIVKKGEKESSARIYFCLWEIRYETRLSYRLMAVITASNATRTCGLTAVPEWPRYPHPLLLLRHRQEHYTAEAFKTSLSPHPLLNINACFKPFQTVFCFSFSLSGRFDILSKTLQFVILWGLLKSARMQLLRNYVASPHSLLPSKYHSM